MSIFQIYLFQKCIRLESDSYSTLKICLYSHAHTLEVSSIFTIYKFVVFDPKVFPMLFEGERSKFSSASGYAAWSRSHKSLLANFRHFRSSKGPLHRQSVNRAVRWPTVKPLVRRTGQFATFALHRSWLANGLVNKPAGNWVLWNVAEWFRNMT